MGEAARRGNHQRVSGALDLGPGQVAWLDRLETEHDNLWAAMSWLVDHDPLERGLRTEPAAVPPGQRKMLQELRDDDLAGVRPPSAHADRRLGG